jgi:hypothetical protein
MDILKSIRGNCRQLLEKYLKPILTQLVRLDHPVNPAAAAAETDQE